MFHNPLLYPVVVKYNVLAWYPVCAAQLAYVWQSFLHCLLSLPFHILLLVEHLKEHLLIN